MKKIFLFLLMHNIMHANVLIFGDTNHQCKCDNKIVKPISLQACQNIEAIDNVNICYFRKNNLGCKKLFSGDKINLDKMDTNTINFYRLLSFKNNAATSFGIKRFSDDRLSIGLPIGTIIKPTKDILIKLDKKYLVSIKLISKNKVIINTSKQESSKIQIKANKLEYGKTYKLHVQLPKKTFTSNFDILDKETEIQVTQEINKAINNITEEKSIKIIKSIIFDQYGLSFDRNNILNKGIL